MSDIDFKKLSKDELEALGLEYGVHLDRKLLKSKMVKQLKNFIDSSTKDELVKPVEPISVSRNSLKVSEDIKIKMRNLNF